MSTPRAGINAGINMIGNCLVVTLKGDLDERMMVQIQKEVLSSIIKNHAKKVLIDVSHICVLDLSVFSVLKDVAEMIYVLGARVIFIGFQAGVASALVDLDADFDNLRTAVTMDDGLEILRGE